MIHPPSQYPQRDNFLTFISTIVNQSQVETISQLCLAQSIQENRYARMYKILSETPTEIRKQKLNVFVAVLAYDHATRHEDKAFYKNQIEEQAKKLEGKTKKAFQDFACINEAGKKFISEAKTPTTAHLREEFIKRGGQTLLENNHNRFLIVLKEQMLAQLNIGISKIVNSERYKEATYITKKAKSKKSKRKQQFVPAKQKNEKEKEVPPDTVSISSATRASSETVKETFFSNLFEKAAGWRERARVKRWQTLEPRLIAEFGDKNNRNETIFRYENLSPEQLMEKRARHYLPETEKLLIAPYKEIYSFKTDRGYGMVAEFTYNGEKHAGILYIGCDSNKCIFHRYFEGINFENSSSDLFAETYEEAHKETKAKSMLISDDAKVQIKEKNGVITFKYPENYKIKIFPLRRDILDTHINPIQK